MQEKFIKESTEENINLLTKGTSNNSDTTSPILSKDQSFSEKIDILSTLSGESINIPPFISSKKLEEKEVLESQRKTIESLTKVNKKLVI